jgi:hypothetical protein
MFLNSSATSTDAEVGSDLLFSPFPAKNGGLTPFLRSQVLVEGKPVEGVGRDRGMVFKAYSSFGWLTATRKTSAA